MEGRQHKMSIHCLCLCAFILYYEHKYMDNCTSNSLKILSSRPLGNRPTVQHSRSFVLPAIYSEAKDLRPERADLRLEMAHFRLELADFKPERADLDKMINCKRPSKQMLASVRC